MTMRFPRISKALDAVLDVFVRSIISEYERNQARRDSELELELEELAKRKTRPAPSKESN